MPPDKSLCLLQWPWSVSDQFYLLYHQSLSFLFLCHIVRTRRNWLKRQSRSWSDKQLCTRRSCCVQGEGRLLQVFCCFVKAAASQVNVFECQGMICIEGCDPKKIQHVAVVQRLMANRERSEKRWQEGGKSVNLSSSHDQKIDQIAGGFFCPHPSHASHDEWDI